MTNKTNKITNWVKRFEERFCVVSKDSEDVWFERIDGRPVVDPHLVFEIEIFIKELLITTIQGIGLEERPTKTVENIIKNPKGAMGKLVDDGYNEYHRKLEEQKQEIIKGLKQ